MTIHFLVDLSQLCQSKVDAGTFLGAGCNMNDIRISAARQGMQYVDLLVLSSTVTDSHVSGPAGTLLSVWFYELAIVKGSFM